MENIPKIKGAQFVKSHEEVESFFKNVVDCDTRELYSILLDASWCFREFYLTTKQEKYLKKSERLEKIYTRLYQYVFDL